MKPAGQPAPATLASIYELARKSDASEFVLNRLYGSRISPVFTYLFARLGASADQVTIAGGACGLTGAALLFLPLSWVSVVGVALLQMGYVLDFSDGQIARLRGIGSSAGGYLDWLTHLYIPVLAVLGLGASLAWSSGTFAYLVASAMAAVVLAAFSFSGKEHLLVAMLRRDPGLGMLPAYLAALRDDARPTDVAGASSRLTAGDKGTLGRFRMASWRGLLGELLIYPGAAHLLTIAIVGDLLVGWLAGPLSMRGMLLVGWALLLFVHVPRVVIRNYRILRLVETARRRQEAAVEPLGGER